MKAGLIGIHLGQERCKLVQLANDKDKFQVVEMISVPTPDDSFSSGIIKAPRVLGDALGRAVASSKFIGRKAVIAYPTETLKIQTFHLQDAGNLDQVIAHRLSQMAFDNPSELTFDYKIIAKEMGRVKATVAITNKRHIEHIKEFAQEAKINLVSTDLEMLSIHRIISNAYRLGKDPAIVALVSDGVVKLSIFIDKVQSSVKTVDLYATEARKQPKLLAAEIGRFIEEYSRENLVAGEATIFLAGLPEPDFEIEKTVWETLGIRTTSIRWCEAFTVSNTYSNFHELATRFGAFSSALGLAVLDLTWPEHFRSPIIVDVRQEGFKGDLLKFAV